MKGDKSMSDKMGKKDNSVFILSIILAVVVAGWAVIFSQNFQAVSGAIFNFLTNDFGWLYLLVVVIFVFFLLGVAFSKYGNIKLGADDSKPDYSTVSWFAMLFGCGMGVGLVFYGVAEPVSHFVNPPTGSGIEAGTEAAANFAIRSSFMHWGFEPWACYAIVGLALAYFMFRRNKEGLLSTVLEPLIGEKNVNGKIGKLVDILATFATLAGVVTSLGLGTMQISSGLNYLFNIPEDMIVYIVIIVAITLIVVWSAMSGLGKGIKIISDANLYIAITFMIIAFVIGPKVPILNNFVNGMGEYLQNFIGDSLANNPFGDNSWFAGWRIYYWAWFIAWGPFVGVFIARISKGRTIREFIMGVMLAPALASFVWFAIFGSLGLNLGLSGTLSMEEMAEIAANPSVGLFVVFSKYPLGFLLSIVAIVLLCTFFITSANSGTFVLSMLTSNGNLNPPQKNKVIWGVLQAATAIGLLMAGGLKPLQTISIAAAFPFIFIMLMTAVSTIKALKNDKKLKE